MAYLLDTNIISNVIRNPAGALAKRLERAGDRHIFTSIIVAAELRFGVAKGGALWMVERVEAMLGRLTVAEFKSPADVNYGKLRAHLERSGTPISANDMLIAAHALATDSVLVTDNINEFSRVPGLKIENWLR
jgi:tRNA(fMet)-specific endonuclease VapC